MPRVADVLAVATRQADDDRRREPVGRAPPHRAAVVQLLVRRVGVLAKLDLGNGHQPADRHAHRAADDPFLGERRVKDARDAERLLQPFRDEMDAALHADILAKNQHARVHVQFALQRAPDGLGESHDRTVSRRRLGGAQRREQWGGDAARRHTIAGHRRRLGVHKPLDARGIRSGARPRPGKRHVHVARDVELELRPVLLAQHLRHQELPQPRQRIALRVRGNVRVRAIPLLVVGPRVARQPRHGEPHQRRPATATHVRDRFAQKPRRPGRVGPVAIAQRQVAEAREVPGDVRSRGLHRTRHRDAEAVVFDIEEHRQRKGRRHRQRRPEAVRRHRRFATDRDGDRAVPCRVLQYVAMVGNRLRPPGGRCVLRAHVAGHRQHDAPVVLRQIADDADVASVGKAPAPTERRREPILDRQPERQEQRSRPIVGAGGVPASGQHPAEDRLRHVMATRRELVEHQVLLWHGRPVAVGILLDVVERTRDERVVRHAAPVGGGQAAGCG